LYSAIDGAISWGIADDVLRRSTPRGLCLQHLRGFFGLFDLGKNLNASLVIGPSCFGKADIPGRAVEQANAEPVLKRFHMSGDNAGRQIKLSPAEEKPLCSTTLTNDSIEETRSIARLARLVAPANCIVPIRSLQAADPSARAAMNMQGNQLPITSDNYTMITNKNGEVRRWSS
jgi:hypothetical protein